MDAAQTIRDCMTQVNTLRQLRAADPALARAVAEVKAFQSRRFTGTYADLLATPTYAPAARFFLDELYGEADYSERDAQFGRIAGTLQTLFPQPVVHTAVALAQLHAQTEALDQSMAQAWLSAPPDSAPTERYAHAWRAVGQRPAREAQLQGVLEMGQDLARLTRTPGLRMMLRMMRGPAQAAGMGSLQHFLEAGFDTFGQLSKQRQGVEQFLARIEEREERLIALLFDANPVTCETELQRTLGQAR